MSELWKSQPYDVLEYWVSTILDEASDLLNTWETSFIESIQEQLQRKRILSQAQQETLEKIYAKYTN